ncbi:S-adenosyl-L-methionine-dependent methyltransferase [Trametopsis cervina]|nr:S-adenosyl-L-methionine-dependent methyltransferase [Trametopsis cervina]
MPSSTSPVSELRALSDLIKAAVDKIEAACTSRGQIYPSANDPFTFDSEIPRASPDVVQDGIVIVAAAAQLIAAVRPPQYSLGAHAVQHHVSSCLRAVSELHVSEIIRENGAGPKGLHVNEIAAVTKTDPSKLARVLRLLATKHIFREVSPDTFAHNRISSMLDTGKPVAAILANPKSKYDNTLGVGALMGHLTDEVFKASPFLTEVLTDANLSHSGEPNQTAFNLAFKTNLPGFVWFESPENDYRLNRFAVGMDGIHKMLPPDVLFNGFEWQKLGQGAVVVDVGGGIGSQSLALAKTFKHLNFVLQDRQPVLDSAQKFWAAQMPDAIPSGKVKLIGHSFFDSQPVQNADVFFMRMILHDWSDAYCHKILSQLRATAQPHTRLVVIDNIVSYACDAGKGSQSEDRINGAVIRDSKADMPAPLLANKGEAGVVSYLADLTMLTFLNGCERTLKQMHALFEASGWTVQQVVLGSGFEGQASQIVGAPST